MFVVGGSALSHLPLKKQKQFVSSQTASLVLALKTDNYLFMVFGSSLDFCRMSTQLSNNLNYHSVTFVGIICLISLLCLNHFTYKVILLHRRAFPHHRHCNIQLLSYVPGNYGWCLLCPEPHLTAPYLYHTYHHLCQFGSSEKQMPRWDQIFFKDLGGRKSGEGAENRDGFQSTVAGVLTQSPCNQRFERSIPMAITDPESFHPEDLSFFIVLKSSAFSQCI